MIWPSLLLTAAVWLGWPGSAARRRLRRLTRPPRASAPSGWRVRRRQSNTDVAAVVQQLAALVRSGASAPRAWELVLAGLPHDEAARRLTRVAAELLEPNETSEPLKTNGFDPVHAVRGAWRFSATSGAALGEVLDSVSLAIRHAEQAKAQRRAAMAAPVATARLLAALPVIGLGLGQAMGVQPMQVLFGTTTGRVCLVTGLVFGVAGAWWSHVLVQRAAR